MLSIGQRTSKRLCLGAWQVKEGQVPGRPAFVVARGLAAVCAALITGRVSAMSVPEVSRQAQRHQKQQHLGQLAVSMCLGLPRAGLGIVRRRGKGPPLVSPLFVALIARPK